MFYSFEMDPYGSSERPPSLRLVRQDVDLVIVGGHGRSPAIGRAVQLVDGRWRLTIPVAGVPIDVRGDRAAGSRAAALVLLRAGTPEP